MKELKLRIINMLEEDSRFTADKLASMLNATKDEVEGAIEELENEGIIVKYTAIIDRNSFDEGVEAFIEVSVTPERTKGFDAIAQEIVNFPQVESVYLMSGGYDLAVIIAGKTLKEVAMFVSEQLSTLENILGTKTHFILKKYKISGIITKKPDENRNKVHF